MHKIAIYGVVEHFVKGKPTVGSHYLGAFPSDRIFNTTKTVKCAFLYSLFYSFSHAGIHVNYTSEFGEIFEDTI